MKREKEETISCVTNFLLEYFGTFIYGGLIQSSRGFFSVGGYTSAQARDLVNQERRREGFSPGLRLLVGYEFLLNDFITLTGWLRSSFHFESGVVAIGPGISIGVGYII